MKRYQIFAYIASFSILLFLFTGCSNNQTQNSNDSSGSKVSTTVNKEKEEEENTQNFNEIFDVPKEEEISSYSTVIKDNSAGRLTNIAITCSTLNNTIVHSKETFSFNKVVGQPTAEKGYQEASVIIDHKTEKGIGGGNCQVSSTLYNAVLAIPNLVVTERHEHGKDVTYVPEGRDAAVSFRFFRLKIS